MLRVESVDERADDVEVFNFEVEEVHNYHVAAAGGAGALVGNKAAYFRPMTPRAFRQTPGGRTYTYDLDKIGGQMAQRGWNERRIGEALDNPTATRNATDRRSMPEGDPKPATGYIHEDGGYVILNDETGDIVQISDIPDPEWGAPWDLD